MQSSGDFFLLPRQLHPARNTTPARRVPRIIAASVGEAVKFVARLTFKIFTPRIPVAIRASSSVRRSHFTTNHTIRSRHRGRS